MLRDVEMLGDVERCWEMLRDVERCWDILRDIPRYWKILRYILRDIFRDIPRYWEILRNMYWGILKEIERYCEMLRDKIILLGQFYNKHSSDQPRFTGASEGVEFWFEAQVHPLPINQLIA